MSYAHSLVIICPAALKPAATALAEQLGWTGDNLTVPLSANGQAPATHFGCHAWAREDAVAVFTTPNADAQVEAVRAQLIVSARDDLSAGEHFGAACAGATLSRVDEA